MANISGSGAPGVQTQGSIGDVYIDTTSGISYKCAQIYNFSETKEHKAKTHYEWMIIRSEGSVGQSQSWNDLKDKPFYEKIKRGEDVYSGELEFIWDQSINLYACSGASLNPSLVSNGVSYIVNWNRTDYNCKYLGAGMLGNKYFESNNANDCTNEPFFFSGGMETLYTNDLNNCDYVASSTEETFPSQELNFSKDQDGFYSALVGDSTKVTAGGIQVVTFDEKEYKCLYRNYGFFGNRSLASTGCNDTGEPFFVDFRTGFMYSKEPGAHTVRIVQQIAEMPSVRYSVSVRTIDEKVIHTLDPKYIPDEHINNLIGEALGVIENGTY